MKNDPFDLNFDGKVDERDAFLFNLFFNNDDEDENESDDNNDWDE